MIIELSKIVKEYKNEKTGIVNEVLKGISLVINKGEKMSIVGPSGSGKSTLLNIIGTMDKASLGSMKFNGREIENYNENQLAEIRNNQIGFIFQSHHLLPQLNVIENVLLPTIPSKKKEDKQHTINRAKQLLTKVNLLDNIYQYPSQLSGGECQRVAVVRALINDPYLILADEPTGSLDEENAEDIGNILSEICDEKNTALIVVTHSQELASRIGNIHKLIKGRIIPA